MKRCEKIRREIIRRAEGILQMRRFPQSWPQRTIDVKTEELRTLYEEWIELWTNHYCGLHKSLECLS